MKSNASHHNLLTALLFSCLFFLLSVAPAFAHSGMHTITLVYSGNLDGELEPCGCSEGGNKGGLKRRAQKIDELRKEDPNLYLISTGGLITSEVPQDKIKAEFILKGLEKLNYDAIGIQWQDLAYGEAFLTNTKLPFVLSNGSTKNFFSKSLINNKHAKLAFFSWLDPNTDPQKNMGQAFVKNEATELQAALKKAKASKQTTVLATTLTLQQAQKTFDLGDVDILLIKANYEKFGEAKKVKNTLVLQPGSRGMRIGKLTLSIDKTGTIKKWQDLIIPLPPEVKDAERMLDWYKAYNDKIKADYEARVALRKKLETGKSPFAGEMVCQNCHPKEHDKWFETRHAEAFFALVDVNKAFDPECIKCHTVGFEVEGGFIDPMITENLQHVQCENCHGPSKAHADSAGQTKTGNHDWKPQQMCQQCHIHEHSPDFKFDQYWPKISHGK